MAAWSRPTIRSTPIRDVARAYDIRWLILERRDIVRALAPVLKGGPRPDWIGAAAFSQ